MPRKLLERLAAERLGPGGEGDELAAYEEDDSELVFDDVGPEASVPLGRRCLALAVCGCCLWRWRCDAGADIRCKCCMRT